MKKMVLSRILFACAAFCICTVIFTACRLTARDGWVTRDGGTYYMVNGNAATEWLELEGSRYYLGSDGVMVTGWQTIDGETYYFLEDGTMAVGWLELDGSRFYLRRQGSLVTGWLSLDGQRYYLNKDGSAAVGITEIDGTAYVFDAEGKLTSGWAEAEGKRFYGDSNGHPVTGWVEIGDVRYCFDEKGIQRTGWVEDGGFTYYFLEDGTPARGECTIGGEVHRFASNGQLIILVNPWNSIPENYTVELVSVGYNHQAADVLYDDLTQMLSDCKNAGLDPVICSSYRTQEYQEKLFKRKVDFYLDQGYSEEEATALAGRSVAVPGTSEHQLGLALDIIDNSNWNLDESQADMPTQKWLMENSWRYGFILRYPDGTSGRTGIIYEPWHYRYVGREVAAEIHELGVCLEEYLELLTVKAK